MTAASPPARAATNKASSAPGKPVITPTRPASLMSLQPMPFENRTKSSIMRNNSPPPVSAPVLSLGGAVSILWADDIISWWLALSLYGAGKLHLITSQLWFGRSSLGNG